jgi:hypothetical protein
MRIAVGGNLARAVEVEIADRDGIAVGGQPTGTRRADAGTAAGDEGDATSGLAQGVLVSVMARSGQAATASSASRS